MAYENSRDRMRFMFSKECFHLRMFFRGVRFRIAVEIVLLDFFSPSFDSTVGYYVAFRVIHIGV